MTFRLASDRTALAEEQRKANARTLADLIAQGIAEFGTILV